MDINFNPGAVLDTPDERDYQWQEIGFSAAPFDWSTGFDIELELSKKLSQPNYTLPVKDQGQSSSCGGQAWSSYDSVFEAMATSSLEERSAKFIYAQTAVAGGGSAGRDNSQLVVDQGVARETALPSYENGNPPSESFMERKQDITPEVRADAKRSRAKGYAVVSSDIDTIAQAIRENYGVVLGVVGQNNGTWLTPFPVPPTMANPRWYHWVYAGKAQMVNGVKHIGFLNSWGKTVGQQGWQWLSEDYIKTKLSGDAYGQAVWTVYTQIFDPSSIDTAFKHTFTKELDFGSIGAEVVALQTALKITGDMPPFVPATGLFGLLTKSAVKKFQKGHGLEQVGRVGPKTLLALNALFS